MTIATTVAQARILSRHNLLDDISTAAEVVLGTVPMDTDRPHIHLGIRALMARAGEIADVLHSFVDGKRTVAELASLIPGAASLEPKSLHLELLSEVNAIGEAAKAILHAANDVAPNVEVFISLLQSSGDRLYDDWARARPRNDAASQEDHSADHPAVTQS